MHSWMGRDLFCIAYLSMRTGSRSRRAYPTPALLVAFSCFHSDSTRSVLERKNQLKSYPLPPVGTLRTGFLTPYTKTLGAEQKQGFMASTCTGTRFAFSWKLSFSAVTIWKFLMPLTSGATLRTRLGCLEHSYNK